MSIARENDNMGNDVLSSFDWRQALLFAFGVVCYYLLFQSFYNMVAFRNLFPYKDLADAFQGMLFNFIPIFVLVMVIFFVVFFCFTSKRTSLKLIADGVLSILMLVGVNCLYMFVVPNYTIDWAGTVFNAIFIFLGIEMIYYLKSFRLSVCETEAQRALAIQYQYDALKAQVNPHFLFNSLNLLYSLISLDTEKSKDFVLSLSTMYRYIMSQQGKDIVPLRMELNFLKNYIEIISMRFLNQFHVEFRGEENVGNQYIVPYTLQLIMENVTKHNVISNRHHMNVVVDITGENVVVENPIVYRSAKSSSRIGLNYITTLYRQHGKAFRVENDGVVFRAIIPCIMPCETKAQ